jgi:hypothetical protein
MTADNLEARQRAELADLRQRMVNTLVTNQINNRTGEATNDEIAAWERHAYREWRETYPALSMMFFSILPDEDDAAVSS